MSTTLSLVSFCPHCFASGQPKFGTPFVVFGSHSKKFHIYQVEHYGVVGFVPHIVQLKKVLGENVVYEKACGICGVNIWESDDGVQCFSVKEWQREITTLKNWNAWISYRTDSDYFI